MCTDLRDLAGADEDDVTRADLNPLGLCTGGQFHVAYGIPSFKPVHPAIARDVQQYPPANDTVGNLLDAVDGRAFARHMAEIAAVIHLTAIEDVRERVPLCPALQGHGDDIIGVAKERNMVLSA